MLNFDKENKITYEQLSFSLQDKLRYIISRAEINKVENLVEQYEQALNGVRFSFVDSLSSVTNPINDREVAILNNDGALVLYVYTNNVWVKIPANDIYYLLTIQQSPHQTIKVTINDKIYTSSLNVLYGDHFTAEVVADEWYIPGIVYPSSGVMIEPTTISATPATRKTDYVLNAVIGKYIDNDDYGIRLNWNGGTDPTQYYGSLSPNMFDWIAVSKRTSSTGVVTYTSKLNFWASGPVPYLFDTVTITMEYNGQTYTIIERVPMSSFNASGDLANHPQFTNEVWYERLKSLKGKSVKIYVNFTLY